MDIHSDDPAFGCRFISDELADAGHVASERRVWRICSQQRIFSAFAKKKGMRKKAGPPVHDDLVRRNFSAPSTGPTRASSTSAPSRIASRTASSGTRSRTV
jgi:putative transposase